MLICYIRAGQLYLLDMLAGVLRVQIGIETWSKPRQLMLQSGPTLHFEVTFYASTLLYISVFAQVFILTKKK